MNFLLLGYLYFYIVISSVESSELHPSIEITEQYENCTQCSVKLESLCKCLLDSDSCLICCADSCCICDDCTLCIRSKQRQTQIVIQVVVSILLGFGIVGLIIIYCKICYRTRRIAHRRRCIVLQQENDITNNCNTIEDLWDRPPPYSETIRGCPPVYTSSHNAPPLYTSPYNRVSMQDSPPSYPGTPKSQERSQHPNESSFSPSVAQHI